MSRMSTQSEMIPLVGFKGKGGSYYNLNKENRVRIETQSIRNGNNIGKIVWICHYHRPDMLKKPLRNIPPTRVYVVSNDELPKHKNVYYSKTHFRPVLKSGEVGSKIISPVDNTGFRSRSGAELYVFSDEEECKKHWNTQLANYFVKLDALIKSAAQGWINEKDKLVKSIAVLD